MLERVLGQRLADQVYMWAKDNGRTKAAELRALVEEGLAQRHAQRMEKLKLEARRVAAEEKVTRAQKLLEGQQRAAQYIGVEYRRGNYYAFVPTSNGERRELWQKHQVAEWAARAYDTEVRLGQHDGVAWAKGLPLNFPNDVRTPEDMLKAELGVGPRDAVKPGARK